MALITLHYYPSTCYPLLMSIESSNHPVPLVTLLDFARKEMPGVWLREHPLGDIELVLYLSSRSSGIIAPTQEAAEWMMKALIERLRLDAIHQLGLNPQLNAWHDQVNTYRESNLALLAERDRLRSVRDTLLARVKELEVILDKEDETDE